MRLPWEEREVFSINDNHSITERGLQHREKHSLAAEMTKRDRRRNIFLQELTEWFNWLDVVLWGGGGPYVKLFLTIHSHL